MAFSQLMTQTSSLAGTTLTGRRSLHRASVAAREGWAPVEARQGGRGRGEGRGRRGRGGRGRGGGRGKKNFKRLIQRSDGSEHLGSALDLSTHETRPFPGPPPDEGPPLRVLPVGGLGEIGMNCMLVGCGDRYILVDAGLMFPDFTDYGMQKILPDTSFLHQWKDKIEGLVITHGHEDHIGALPWVIPALDPNVPIYAGSFCMQLVKRRMQEFNLWNDERFRTFNMRERFQLGPFEMEPFRVTHSIPDCCGLVMRSEHGNILHTGDWKIDETPVDGDSFDRQIFEQMGKEGVALMMSDSTNVLSAGRTTSEAGVETSMIQRVLGHEGKGRVVTTCFASNMHRISSIKKAADAAGRKICFIGMSLHTYLEAAWKDGRAPFDPRELIHVAELDDYEPHEVLIVTTGSQAEPRSALNLASFDASHTLKLRQEDLVMYSAKIIPGNDSRVMKMINRIAESGVELAYGAAENLHTSGHAHRGELDEVLKTVQPQHFLPVHGEYAFLCAHAELARQSGCQYTEVIRNGQMLGVAERPNRNHVSSGSSLMQLMGEAKLTPYYNDGERGTGTADEMSLDERQTLVMEGVVVAALDLARVPPSTEGARAAPSVEEISNARLRAKIRLTTRGMWTDNGKLLEALHKAAEQAVTRLPGDASLVAIERVVTEALRRMCKQYNNRKSEVIVVVHEYDPRAGAAAAAAVQGRVAAAKAAAGDGAGRGAARSGRGGRGRGRGRGAIRGDRRDGRMVDPGEFERVEAAAREPPPPAPPAAVPAPPEILEQLEQRKAQNPRDAASGDDIGPEGGEVDDLSYG